MAAELARNLARRRLEQSLGGEGDGLVAREFGEDAARVLPRVRV